MGQASGPARASLQEDMIAAIQGITVPPPVGGATETKQDTQITNLGSPSEAAATSDTGTFSLIRLFKRLLQKLTTGIPLTAGEAHVGEMGGNLVRVTAAEMTRPANTTAYAAGDVVSNSESATTPLAFTNIARINGGSGYIVRASVTTDKKQITPRVRVHLFNAADATVSVDNTAYRELYADIGKRVGYFDLPAMTTAPDATNSDMSRSFDNALRVPFVCAAGSRDVYVVLETLDAFTPNSGQKFTVVLWADNN